MSSVATGTPLVFNTMGAGDIEQDGFVQITTNLAQQPASVTFADWFVVDNHQPNSNQFEEIKHFACVKMAFQPPWRFHRRINDMSQLVVIRQQRDDQVATMAGSVRKRWCANW